MTGPAPAAGARPPDVKAAHDHAVWLLRLVAARLTDRPNGSATADLPTGLVTYLRRFVASCDAAR